MIITAYKIDLVFCWYAIINHNLALPLYSSNLTVPIRLT